MFSDDFGLRSPGSQKSFQTKTASTSIVSDNVTVDVLECGRIGWYDIFAAV